MKRRNLLLAFLSLPAIFKRSRVVPSMMPYKGKLWIKVGSSVGRLSTPTVTFSSPRYNFRKYTGGLKIKSDV